MNNWLTSPILLCLHFELSVFLRLRKIRKTLESITDYDAVKLFKNKHSLNVYIQNTNIVESLNFCFESFIVANEK